MARNIAFITGASRGIGLASALALAEQGFDIVATARTVVEGEHRDYRSTFRESPPQALPGSIELTAAQVRERGRECLPIRLDLLDLPSVDAALDQTLKEWGHIDVLLNNGIYQGPGLMDRFLDIPIDVLDDIFLGNVKSQLHITQRVLRHMLARGDGGTIVNMTSGSALMNPPAPPGEGGWGFAYAASKAAFNRMVGSVHAEYGSRGIRCFNLNPGYVLTEAQKLSIGEDNEFTRRFRGAPPEVPAAVIAWLASSPEADELAGEVVDAMRECRVRDLLPGWPPPRT